MHEKKTDNQQDLQQATEAEAGNVYFQNKTSSAIFVLDYFLE